MPKVYLRNFSDSDLDLMVQWLAQPYIEKWFEHPENWLKEIRGRKGEYQWIQHFIVMLAEQPIGFCQYYDCYAANEVEDWYQVNTPGELFSLDYLIGEPDYLRQGLGKQIVAQLIEKIWDLDAQAIIVAPEPENQASVGVLLANNFQWVAERKYFILTNPSNK